MFDDHRVRVFPPHQEQEGGAPVLLAVRGKEALEESLQVGVLACRSPAGCLLAHTWQICLLDT